MELRLEEAIAAVAFVGARVSGVMVFAPFLGSSAIAPRIKVGLVVLLTAVLYPVCGPRGLSLTAAGTLRVMLSEALIGLLMGLAIQFVFEAAQFAGQLMGMQVGFGLVNILDPNTQVDTPVLAVFSQTVVMLIFLQMDVHHWLLRGLANSFQYLPAGAAITSGELIRQLLHAAGGIWLAGVQVAAPALILGLSVKSMVGLSVLALSLKYWPGIFERYFSNGIRCGERLLQLAH
jgi:flagellar biosynthesis protein FliR